MAARYAPKDDTNFDPEVPTTPTALWGWEKDVLIQPTVPLRPLRFWRTACWSRKETPAGSHAASGRPSQIVSPLLEMVADTLQSERFSLTMQRASCSFCLLLLLAFAQVRPATASPIPPCISGVGTIYRMLFDHVHEEIVLIASSIESSQLQVFSVPRTGGVATHRGEWSCPNQQQYPASPCISAIDPTDQVLYGVCQAGGSPPGTSSVAALMVVSYNATGAAVATKPKLLPLTAEITSWPQPPVWLGYDAGLGLLLLLTQSHLYTIERSGLVQNGLASPVQGTISMPNPNYCSYLVPSPVLDTDGHVLLTYGGYMFGSGMNYVSGNMSAGYWSLTVPSGQLLGYDGEAKLAVLIGGPSTAPVLSAYGVRSPFASTTRNVPMPAACANPTASNMWAWFALDPVHRDVLLLASCQGVGNVLVTAPYG